MKYRFDTVELDSLKVELRRDGRSVSVEPQVFALLLLIVENHDRMVSRDEIIEKVWDGRFVSDSAVSSRIKAARRAIGDDGVAQRYIRTVHGRGYICTADVRLGSALQTGHGSRSMGLPASNDPGRGAAKPSIAVLPFQRIGALGRAETIAEGLPHEIIAALSRLRWLMVIARGSAFRFRGAEPDMRLVGQALGVRYCLSGCVERAPGGITVTVNLTETGDASVVWSERYATTAEDIHHIRSEITAAIVSALEIHVPLNEAWAARNTSSENLDAWSHYHLGLQHMYRFNRVDNARAADHFRSATRLDPEFSRAFAGLSFTSFQDAYLLYSDDAASAALMARRAAERSLELDPLDPFGHFTLGRSCWLQGNIEDSLGWLERAVALNPNYAQGHYALSWASTMLGDGAAGGAFVDTAMTLSPLDPFLYAMKGTRALSCLATGQLADATRWIDAAARTPGAHSVVNLVAAVIHAIAGEDTVAADWVGTARARNPTLSQSLFFQSMPFQDRQLRRKAEAALTRFGLH